MSLKLIAAVTLQKNAEEAEKLMESGADELLIRDRSNGDAERTEAITCLRGLLSRIHIPVFAAGRISRLEDVKKYIYAGADKVVFDLSDPSFDAVIYSGLITEAAARFGREKIAACALEETQFAALTEDAKHSVSVLIGTDRKAAEEAAACHASFYEISAEAFTGTLAEEIRKTASLSYADGFVSADFDEAFGTIRELKKTLLKEGVDLYRLTSSLSFGDLKKGPDGLVPVIVQDFTNDEVLMMAYMNEEAFEDTLITGRMHYYSRSRNEQWLKGETSGHYQYVRSLSADCDRDTLLAKVVQVGAACHTGSRSCFYTEIAGTGEEAKNPFRILEDVYSVIDDRKKNPREGSYTNYLFEKGIDKILKKVGEESTETVIAAKNPGSEEIVYEISDLLYHLMVLMSLKEVTWTDITEELSRRH